MLLSGLEIENFKPFGTRQVASFAPITLLFGKNCAGKSSILQALLALKQTQELAAPGDLSNPGQALRTIPPPHGAQAQANSLVTRGSFVDLGSFKDAAFNRDPMRRIHLRLILPNIIKVPVTMEWLSSILPDTHPWLEWVFQHGKPDGQLAEITSGMGTEWLTKVCNAQFSKELNPALIANIVAAVSHENATIKADPTNDKPSTLERIRYALEHLEGVSSIGLMSDSDEPLLDEAIRRLLVERRIYWQGIMPVTKVAEPSLAAYLDGFLPGLSFFLEELSAPAGAPLAKLAYLSGQRPDLQLINRTFQRNEPGVGARGEYLANVLAADPQCLVAVNDWLKILETGHQLHIETNDDYGVIIMQMRPDNLTIPVLPSAVGAGLQRLLYAIVQLVVCRDRLLLIEEPEGNLHPGLQARIGDLIIESAKVRYNQIILETHSEHLILRLLRRVRETTQSSLEKGCQPLYPKDLSVLHVLRREGSSAIRNTEVTPDGDFASAWPEGFFVDRTKELF